MIADTNGYTRVCDSDRDDKRLRDAVLDPGDRQHQIGTHLSRRKEFTTPDPTQGLIPR